METEVDWKDQYKHPNWQKKRLEALEAHGFKCMRCEGAEKQLQVHHKAYIKGRRVWDYTVDELLVLCDECHQDAHFGKDVLNEILLRSDAQYLDCAALLFNFCGASVHPEDEIERGLKEYNEALLNIGTFARCICDFDPRDLETILSLEPGAFHELANIALSLRKQSGGGV